MKNLGAIPTQMEGEGSPRARKECGQDVVGHDRIMRSDSKHTKKPGDLSMQYVDIALNGR